MKRVLIYDGKHHVQAKKQVPNNLERSTDSLFIQEHQAPSVDNIQFHQNGFIQQHNAGLAQSSLLFHPTRSQLEQVQFNNELLARLLHNDDVSFKSNITSQGHRTYGTSTASDNIRRSTTGNDSQMLHAPRESKLSLIQEQGNHNCQQLSEQTLVQQQVTLQDAIRYEEERQRKLMLVALEKRREQQQQYQQQIARICLELNRMPHRQHLAPVTTDSLSSTMAKSTLSKMVHKQQQNQSCMNNNSSATMYQRHCHQNMIPKDWNRPNSNTSAVPEFNISFLSSQQNHDQSLDQLPGSMNANMYHFQFNRSSMHIDLTSVPLTLPVLLVRPIEDRYKLSDQQFLLRQQIEVFEAGEDDVTVHTRGRNKPISYGQVGIRCKHCAHVHVSMRQKGSTYFPSNKLGIYQAAQNMATTHLLCGLCEYMPETLKKDFEYVMSNRHNGMNSCNSIGAGRPYWARCATELGLLDTENGIRFIRTLQH